MDKDELIQFLSDNLTIELTTQKTWDFGANYVTIKAVLMLDNKIISQSSDTIDI